MRQPGSYYWWCEPEPVRLGNEPLGGADRGFRSPYSTRHFYSTMPKVSIQVRCFDHYSETLVVTNAMLYAIPGGSIVFGRTWRQISNAQPISLVIRQQRGLPNRKV